MSNTTAQTSVEVYGHTFNIAALPHATLVALAIPTLRHKLGNEVASKVSTFKESDEYNALPNDEARQSAVATRTNQLRAELVKAIHDGTIGVAASRGPRGTALDTIVRQVATEQVKAWLDGNKIVAPKGKDTIGVKVGVEVVQLTMADLVNKRIAGKFGDAIRKEAQKRMDAAKRVAGAGGAKSEDGVAMLDDF